MTYRCRRRRRSLWAGAVGCSWNLTWKITFPNGNRDLVLKYASHSNDGNRLLIVMKDIQLEVYVTLEYELDAETGILRRSATIENRTKEAFMIEHVAAGTWKHSAWNGLSLYAPCSRPLGCGVDRPAATGASG